MYETTKHAATLFPNMSTYVVADGCAAKSMQEHVAALEKISQKTSANVISRSQAETVLTECAESSKNNKFDGGSGDQWLLVDKIFAFADHDDNKELSIEELKSIGRSMPSIDALVSILSDSIGESGSITRESMYKILFERKPRSGCSEWIPIFIVMYLLPIMYSMSTRLPFIFLALEIVDARQGTLIQVSWVTGVYQTSRAIGNVLVVVFGGKNPFKRLEILQVVFGLAGWLWLGFYQRDNATSFFCGNSCDPVPSESSPLPIWPLFGLFFVGLGETVVNLQQAIMLETGKESPSGIVDEKILTTRLSMQYSMVTCGGITAMVFGGFVYTKWGYTAICEVGIFCQIVQLIGTMIYLWIASNGKKEIQREDIDGNDLIRCVIYQFQASSVIANFAKDIARGTEHSDNLELSGGLANATRRAKEDKVLTHSLQEMYRFFFRKDRDDIAAMDDLLTSVDNSGTGLASKRPEAMAIGKNKLSKLVLFLTKKAGGRSLTEREFVSYWGPRVYQSMFESSSGAT